MKTAAMVLSFASTLALRDIYISSRTAAAEAFVLVGGILLMFPSAAAGMMVMPKNSCVLNTYCTPYSTRISGDGSKLLRTAGSTSSTSTSRSSSTHLSLFPSRKNNNNNNAALVVPGIGPEGCALPSPSGVNTLSEPIQAIIVLAIFAALGISSVAFSSFLDDITLKYEWVQNWRYTWPLLGAIYAAAGVTHFTLESEYINIYPRQGAWGIWYLPGSPKFHVQWTGIAEILGGLGLLIGGAYDAFMPVWGECPNVLTHAGIGSDAAAGLLLLTVAVTPANVYMFTHGAKLPMDGPEVPVVGHLIRGIMQVVLFGLLYQMGQGSLEEIVSTVV